MAIELTAMGNKGNQSGPVTQSGRFRACQPVATKCTDICCYYSSEFGTPNLNSQVLDEYLV